MLQVRGILLALGLTGKLVVVLNQALDAPGPDGAFFFPCVWISAPFCSLMLLWRLRRLMLLARMVRSGRMFSLVLLCLVPGALGSVL